MPFIIVYNKDTKLITHWKNDTSTNPMTIEDELKHNSLGNDNPVAIEVDSISNEILIGRDLFDEVTNTIKADPNWREPVFARPSSGTIPTTNVSA